MRFLISGLAVLCMATVSAEVKTKSPKALGGTVSMVETDLTYRYIHVFTNTTEVKTFKNRSDRPLSLRILAVGGGGCGGVGGRTFGNGGGGGGGGGVLETNNVIIAARGVWNISVGNGGIPAYSADSSAVASGATVLSNGTEEFIRVPGGGNGSFSTGSGTGTEATAGAAGGGGSRAKTTGASGTYASSILGTVYNMNAGGSGGTYGGGGGGGAGTVGSSFADGAKGGEGLASDITGEMLVYGSGGGGGGNISDVGVFNNGGLGGTRAGDAGYIQVVGSETTITNQVSATKPAPNSGCGGGGGVGGKGAADTASKATQGAAGIVVISYEVPKMPFSGGIVSKIAQTGDIATFIHVFTNTSEVASFSNTLDRAIAVRILAVGGGGCGGRGGATTGNGGGGGGGGGVLETNNVVVTAGGNWNILVGNGGIPANLANSSAVASGATVLSNGTEEFIRVPGGGNGSFSTGSGTGTEATAGAAGGGGSRAKRTGALGTYASSILGTVYNMNAGGSGGTYGGGGGGGAGTVGSSFADGAKGGEGLASDITGEMLVYGSGGGGGGNISEGGVFNNGGLGGTRAGDAGYIQVVGSETTITNQVSATKPAPNSGCGGGGGVGGKGTGDAVRYATQGAAGIVVIRYDWNVVPPKKGLILSFR